MTHLACRLVDSSTGTKQVPGLGIIIFPTENYSIYDAKLIVYIEETLAAANVVLASGD